MNEVIQNVPMVQQPNNEQVGFDTMNGFETLQRIAKREPWQLCNCCGNGAPPQYVAYYGDAEYVHRVRPACLVVPVHDCRVQ